MVFNKQYFSQLKETMLYIFIDDVGYFGHLLVQDLIFTEFTIQAKKSNFITKFVGFCQDPPVHVIKIEVQKGKRLHRNVL